MKNRVFLFILFLIIIQACTLFLSPYKTIESNVYQNSIFVDTFIIDSLGLYEFEYYSDYHSDVIFFSNSAGLDSFINKNKLYSEAVLFPFLKEKVIYFNEEIFFYTFDTIYIVIDNTDFMTEDTSMIKFTLDIYYKEK